MDEMIETLPAALVRMVAAATNEAAALGEALSPTQQDAVTRAVFPALDELARLHFTVEHQRERLADADALIVQGDATLRGLLNALRAENAKLRQANVEKAEQITVLQRQLIEAKAELALVASRGLQLVPGPITSHTVLMAQRCADLTPLIVKMDRYMREKTADTFHAFRDAYEAARQAGHLNEVQA